MKVIFRKFSNGDVIAWLPELDVNPGHCMSYMHIGQHGEGVYPAHTVPATPNDYAPLLAELTRIYEPESLTVVKRMKRQIS